LKLDCVQAERQVGCQQPFCRFVVQIVVTFSKSQVKEIRF